MLENLLVSGNADWLLLSSVIGDVSVLGSYFGAARFSASCTDGSCTITTGTLVSALQPTQEFEINETLTVTDFGFEGFFSDWTTPAEDIETRILHGMNLVQTVYSGDDTVGLFIGEGTFWGGWLEHQVFGTFHAGIATEDGASFEMGLGMSLGDATRAPFPAGNATFTGAMTGLETEGWEAIEGRATISVRNLGTPEVDARFTQIVGTDGGGSREDISWLGIPLDSDSFYAGTAEDFIQGVFYGPLHVEVGGVFERSGIVGAFGGRRP